MPGGSVQAGLGLNAGPDGAARCPVANGMLLQVLGDVEIGLVQRERFDEWRMLGEDRPDLLRDRLVDVEARRDEDQFGALPLRGDRRHRRAHAELARLVARGRYDAPFARSADRDRLAAQFRIVALFDRRIECIHVDVDDLANAPPCCRPRMHQAFEGPGSSLPPVATI